MAAPANAFEQLVADVAAVLDASDLQSGWNAYADGGDSDPNYPAEWVKYSVRAAAAEVIEAVVASSMHPSRPELLTLSAELAHGDLLPPHLGKHGDVLVLVAQADPDGYAPAFERSLESVLWKRRLYGSDAGAIGQRNYFITDAEVIYFAAHPTEGRAKVYLCELDLAGSDVTDFDAIPLSLHGAIVACALAKLFAQAGEKTQAAGYFRRIWETARAALAAGETPDRPNPFVAESA